MTAGVDEETDCLIASAMMLFLHKRSRMSARLSCNERRVAKFLNFAAVSGTRELIYAVLNMSRSDGPLRRGAFCDHCSSYCFCRSATWAKAATSRLFSTIATARKNRRQHLSAAKLPFAHLHPAHAKLQRTPLRESVTFLICHGETF